MAPRTLTIGATTNAWEIHFNGNAYRVTRRHYPAIYYPANIYRTARREPPRDYWRIHGAQGIHAYARELDQDKPTFQKILKAFKDHIGETMPSDCIGS